MAITALDRRLVVKVVPQALDPDRTEALGEMGPHQDMGLPTTVILDLLVVVQVARMAEMVLLVSVVAPPGQEATWTVGREGRRLSVVLVWTTALVEEVVR